MDVILYHAYLRVLSVNLNNGYFENTMVSRGHTLESIFKFVSYLEKNDHEVTFAETDSLADFSTVIVPSLSRFSN